MLHLLYRIPGSELRALTLQTVVEKEAEVVLRPFEGTPEFFGGASELSQEEFWAHFALEHSTEQPCVPNPVHQERVSKAIERIQRHELQKVVLSRPHFMAIAGLDPRETFMDLERKYPTCTVFALHHSSFGSWMGATPEVLLSKEADGYSSMSLAGTRLAGSVVWGNKELEEQKWVTKEVHRSLKSFGGKVTRDPQQTFQAGPVEHLLTWVRTDNLKIPVIQALESLHPTPAVCGTPMEKAREVIADLEQFDRSLYTGYLAFLHPHPYAVVLLRSMRWFKDGITFYAGGGITKDSVPLNEWMETEHKISALKDVVQH